MAQRMPQLRPRQSLRRRAGRRVIAATAPAAQARLASCSQRLPRPGQARPEQRPSQRLCEGQSSTAQWAPARGPCPRGQAAAVVCGCVLHSTGACSGSGERFCGNRSRLVGRAWQILCCDARVVAGFQRRSLPRVEHQAHRHGEGCVRPCGRGGSRRVPWRQSRASKLLAVVAADWLLFPTHCSMSPSCGHAPNDRALCARRAVEPSLSVALVACGPSRGGRTADLPRRKSPDAAQLSVESTQVPASFRLPMLPNES